MELRAIRGFESARRGKSKVSIYIYIAYGIESAAYGVIFTSCLCQNPNERGTSECVCVKSPHSLVPRSFGF